jgi:uncharacterized protein YjdB
MQNATIAVPGRSAAAPRRRKVGLLASGLVMALAAGVVAITPPQAADAAIAGTTRLIDVPQQALTNAAGECELGDYCLSYAVTLKDATVFQAEIKNPTSSVEIGLFDAFGNKVEGGPVDANTSSWMNVGVQADGALGLGVQPTVQPGEYRLSVGSDSQLHFGLLAFEIPNSLKLVGTNSVTKGEFSDGTTRRVSGKYTSYSDGVAFNANAGAEITIKFVKPGENQATIALYDSYRNQIASTDSHAGGTAELTQKVPFSGLYQVVIEGESQGKFSLKLSQYSKVTKVSVKQKTVTLKLNKKSKRSIKLKATVAPANASNKKVTWASSNTKVAKVSKSGKVTARKAGKAVITATTQDGAKRAKVKIVVKKR